jgi:hypothetical protein
MPAPKDPEKYLEWKRKKSEAMKGKNTYEKTPEIRAKISASLTGKTLSNDTKKKMSESRKGMVHSGSFKKGVAMRKGIVHTEEANQKNRDAHLGIYDGDKNPFYGRTHTEESKQKIRETRGTNYNGDKNPFYGKTHSDETKLRISINRTGKHTGEEHHHFKNGSSYNGYCKEWKPSRERCRAFFAYTCVECGKHESENITKQGVQKKLDVHHVYGNKNMCCNEDDPNKRKMVPLCIHCHRIVTFSKDESYWQERFSTLIDEQYGGKCYYTKEEYRKLRQETATP